MNGNGAAGFIPRRHGLLPHVAENRVHCLLGHEWLLTDGARSHPMVTIFLRSRMQTLVLYCVECDLQAGYLFLPSA